MPLRSARLFFDMSEKVRSILESYFRLDTPLYFSYSHLVCRSAIDGESWSYGGLQGSVMYLTSECVQVIVTLREFITVA